MSEISPGNSNLDPGQPFFKDVVELQKTALNALMLVNGGAVVAILTLMGNVGAKSSDSLNHINTTPMRIALVCFAFGLFISVLTAVAALFWAHARTNTLPASKCVYLLSVYSYVRLFGFGVLSFVLGSGFAIYALANF